VLGLRNYFTNQAHAEMMERGEVGVDETSDAKPVPNESSLVQQIFRLFL
jgi:hypothetical protein